MMLRGRAMLDLRERAIKTFHGDILSSNLAKLSHVACANHFSFEAADDGHVIYHDGSTAAASM